MLRKSPYTAPTVPLLHLPSQRWLEECAQPFLDDHHILYWNRDPQGKWDGFTVYLDGGREVTVKLTERGER